MPVEQAFLAAAELMRSAAAASRCDLSVLEGRALVGLAGVDGDGPCLEFAGRRRDLDHAVLEGGALAGLEPVAVVDIEADPRAGEDDRAALRRLGYRSCLVMPLCVDGRAVGDAVVFSVEPRAISMDDVLQGLAELAAQAIANARQQRSSDQHHLRLEAMVAVTRSVSSSTSLEDVLSDVVDSAGRALGVPRCLLSLHDPERDALVLRARRDETATEESDPLGTAYPLDEWPHDRRLLEAGLTVQDLVVDPELDAATRSSMQANGELRALVVPLFEDGRTSGLLEFVDGATGRPFTEDEVSVAEALAQHASIAIRNAASFQRQRDRNQQLVALLGAAEAATSSLDVDEILTSVARHAAEALGSPECIIYDYDASADTCVLRGFYEREPSGWDALGRTTRLSDFPADAAMLRAGTPVVFTMSDPQLDDVSRASMKLHGEKTALSVPLAYGDERLGILVLVESEQERRFAPDEIELARGIARQAAVAMHNARLYAAVEEQNRGLEAVLSASRAITGRIGLPDILDVIATQATLALGTPDCTILEYDAARDVIIPRANVEQIPTDWDRLGLPLPLAEHPIERRLLQTGELLVETVSDPDLDPGSRAVMERWHDKTALSVPLVADDEPQGILVLWENREERVFTATELELARGLAEQAAVAIRTSRLYAQLSDSNAELARAGERLRLLNESGQEVSSTLDLDEVLHATALRLCGALGADDCDIYIVHEDSAVCAVSLIGGQTDDTWQGREVSVGSWAPLRHVVEQRESTALSIDDPRLGGEARASMDAYGQASALFAPLIVGDQVVGCVELFDHRVERRFSPEEVALAAEICRVAAAAMDNARLYERLKSQNEQLELGAHRLTQINQSGLEVVTALEPERVLATAAEGLCSILDVTGCEIHRLVGDDLLECMVSFLEQRFWDEARGRRQLLRDLPPCQMAIERGTPFAISSRLEPSMMAVPLKTRGRVIGVVELTENRRERRFTADELATAATLCGALALAIDNAELYSAQELERHRLASLLDVSRAIASTESLDQALAIVARRAAEGMGVAECIVYELVAETDERVCRATWSVEPVEGRLGARSSLTAEEGRIIEGGVPVQARVSDPGIHSAGRASRLKLGEKACLSVPLAVGGESLGLLVLIDPLEERVFTEAEVRLAAGLADEAAIALNSGRLRDEQRRRVRDIEMLNRAAAKMATGLDASDIVHRSLAVLNEVVPFDEAVVLITARDGTVQQRYHADGPAEETTGRGRIPAKLLRQLAHRTLVPLKPGFASRLGMTRKDAAIRVVAVGLVGDGGVNGVLCLGSYDAWAGGGVPEDVVVSFAAHLSLAVNNARLYGDVRAMHHANLRALASSLLVKDAYTLGHSNRVAAYTVLLAHELGWSQEVIDGLAEVSYLHDIGKIAVSDRILLKPGPLSDGEWELMRQHPGLSRDILASVFSDDLLLAVRHHHERWDGKGYPDGLAGEDIPLLARAMAIADAYDAMSSQRLYRPVRLSEDCREELVRCSGRQFDPEMVGPFLRLLDTLRGMKSIAEAAARDAAANIDVERHRALRLSGDADLPAYAETVAVLRAAADRHPPVTSMTTEALVGTDGMMIIVDDDDPKRRAQLGEQIPASHEELALFAGSPTDTCTVDADPWGTWICGLAPLRDGRGTLEALVCAAMPALQGAGAGLAPSETALTFASVLRGAVSRTRRAELEAVTDSLTGLFNHRYFQERLSSLAESADPTVPVSLLFCDLDLFKALNDAKGHRAGDAALCRTGQLMQQAIRSGDTAARYGGDEFALLLVGTDREAAVHVAERIRALVSREFPRGDDPGLSVSIGVAEYPADAPSLGGLLDVADVAMYAAKRAGRDRVAAYHPGLRLDRDGTFGEPDGA